MSRRAAGGSAVTAPARALVSGTILTIAVTAAAALAGPPADLRAPGAAAQPKDSASVVTARLRPAGLTAAPGDTIDLEVDLEIARGWHLYAHGDTVYYGIDLILPEDAPLRAVAGDYPAGETVTLFGEEAHVLSGRQEIGLRAVVADGAEPGRREVDLALSVQACDDRRCLAPASVALPLALDVAAPGGR